MAQVHKFMKMAKIDNEQDFYKKYPDEDAFFKRYPQAKWGKAMKCQPGAAIDVPPTGSVPPNNYNTMMYPDQNEYVTNGSMPPPVANNMTGMFAPNNQTAEQADDQNSMRKLGQPNMTNPYFNNPAAHSNMQFQPMTTGDSMAAGKRPKKPLKGHFKTTDVVALGIQGVNAMLPWQQPKDNQNLYTQAYNTHPAGTGSYAAAKDGKELPVIQSGFFPNQSGWAPKQVAQPIQDTGAHYLIPQPSAGQYNPPTVANPNGFDSRLPEPKIGFKKAAKGFKINPEHKGYCTPMTKSTCTGKRKQFAINAKNHFKKAADGDSIGTIRQNYNDQQNAPAEYWNHDEQYQDPSVIPVQQDIMNLSKGSLGTLGQKLINTPAGISPVDGWKGTKTGAYSYKPLEYQYEHTNRPTEINNVGTNYEQGIAQDAQRMPQGPQNWNSNATGMDINGVQHNYNKYLQDTPVSAEGQSQSSLPTNFTGQYQGRNYISGKLDSPSAANGMMLPAGNGINIQGKYQPISQNTVELKDSSHAVGGQMINANGTTVEAEGPNGDGQGGETLHISPVDGSVNVGGNMYIGDTGIKFKKAFQQIGKTEEKITKVEQKTAKFKDKITTIADNITDPMNKYGSPTAGTVRVLHDAAEQKQAETDMANQKVAQVKQYLTDMQNAQLQQKGEQTAKKGMKIPKMIGGGDPNDIPTGTVSDWFASDLRQYNNKGTTKTPIKKGKKVIPTPTGTYDPMNQFAPTTPFKINQPGIPYSFNSRNQPGIPESFNGQSPNTLPVSNDVQIPITNPTITPAEMNLPDLPAVIPYNQLEKDGTEKKPLVKGMRNKFHIGDYLGEIMAGFEKVQPVQSMQVNPILEPEYNLSLQQKKNSIISAYNPALGAADSAGQQAAIAGQMAEQLGAVDSEELGLNQQNQGAIRARNYQELHHTTDANTQLAMQQLQQQAQAKAITEQDHFNAANSISSKEAQRRYHNDTLGMYEQHTGWARNNNGNWLQIRPDYQFGDPNPHTPSVDETPDTKSHSKYTQYTYDEKGRKTGQIVNGTYTSFEMGGMMSGPMPGMGTPIAMRKKTKKAAMGKKLKYC